MIQVFKQIRDRMKPPQWASWQTLIFLSVFSAIVAALTTSPPPQIAQRIISSFGWIFLILGVWWFTYEPSVKKGLTFYNFFVGPWIVGALICIYIFGTIEGKPIPTQAAFISWPPISAIIWSSPKFVKSDPDTKSPVYTNPTVDRRQEIILVFLANLVISSWFQFSFKVNDWLAANPTLQAGDLSRSAFVWRPQQFDRATAVSRGTDLLNNAAQRVKNQLEGKPWSEVERWLEQRTENLPNLLKDSQPTATADNNLWQLDSQVTSFDDAYDLQLIATWQGPTSRPTRYQMSRMCRITQTRKQGPVEQFKFDNPNSPAAVSSPRPRYVGTVQCGAIQSPETNPQAGT